MKRVFLFSSLLISNITVFILYLKISRSFDIFPEQIYYEYVPLGVILLVFICMFLTSEKKKIKTFSNDKRLVKTFQFGNVKVDSDMVLSELYDKVKSVNGVDEIEFDLRELNDHYFVNVSATLKNEDYKISYVSKDIDNAVTDLFKSDYNYNGKLDVIVNLKLELGEAVITEDFRKELDKVSNDKKEEKKETKTEKISEVETPEDNKESGAIKETFKSFKNIAKKNKDIKQSSAEKSRIKKK